MTILEPAHANVVFREAPGNPGLPFANDEPKEITCRASEPSGNHARPPRSAPRTSARNVRAWIFHCVTDDHAPQHLLGVIRRSLIAIDQNFA